MFRVAFSFALLLLVFCQPSYGELPPGTYDNLLKKAEEVLKIEISSVKELRRDQTNIWWRVTAKVLDVDKSKAKKKTGDVISFLSYTVHQPAPGPRPPERLYKGWKGTAYLNGCQTEELCKEAQFELAAYGASLKKQKGVLGRLFKRR